MSGVPGPTDGHVERVVLPPPPRVDALPQLGEVVAAGGDGEQESLAQSLHGLAGKCVVVDQQDQGLVTPGPELEAVRRMWGED